MKTSHINMFKLYIFLGMLLFIVTGAQAQSEDLSSLTPEDRATKWTQWMKKELKISAEQEPTVHEINLKYAQQTESIRAQDGSRKSKFQEVKAVDSAKDEELKTVLTPDQFTLYLDKKREMQKKFIKAVRDKKDGQ
jgi:hypothetical protein